MTEDELAKAISRAKIGLIQKPETTFISTICFSLELIVSEAHTKTAATNGKQLIINPKFFAALPIDERVFVLAHEALHVAYMHMIRVGDRNFKKWNKACDYVINGFLAEAGFKVPNWVLYNKKFDGLSSEQVYDRLPDDPPNDDFECDMEPIDGDASPADKQKAKEITDIVVRAQLYAEMKGEKGDKHIPGEIKRYLEDMLNPKVDWRKVLARLLKSMSKSDYSTKKFNRKYLQHGLYFPTLVSEGNLSQVSFAVDVSGSVTDKVCTQFCSEMYSVLKQYSPELIEVIQFDHEVQKVSVVKGFRDLTKLSFVGGGGTLIRPVFQTFKESKSKALIILTDGHIWHRDMQYLKKVDNRPVFWCIYDNPKFRAPFGKVIHFTLK
ncbi:DUF2201 family putative metallopeptidase [Acinetobacter sp. A47]|uniref:vWA domain-containing protein n=1 Tax=Acinetobacter sp. A47 TaxID=1561217 RepID=UPI00056EBBD4|nr:VWA-like domain-containing protein [Acinetobacter sp. A47]